MRAIYFLVPRDQFEQPHLLCGHIPLCHFSTINSICASMESLKLKKIGNFRLKSLGYMYPHNTDFMYQIKG